MDKVQSAGLNLLPDFYRYPFPGPDQMHPRQIGQRVLDIQKEVALKCFMLKLIF